jgi:DNA-binding NarL/FixJ family response regulator
MLPLKTFIVEDSAVILENLIVALEELTEVRVVGTAADEEAAVAWMRNEAGRFDLVIVDVFLNSGSGLGVLQAANQMSSHSRRVVLTNYATMEMRKRCMELGADRVFDKSGELDQLINYCGRIADGTATAPGRSP